MTLHFYVCVWKVVAFLKVNVSLKAGVKLEHNSLLEKLGNERWKVNLQNVLINTTITTDIGVAPTLTNNDDVKTVWFTLVLKTSLDYPEQV